MVDGHRTHSTINSPTNTSFTSFRLPLQRLTSAQRNHDRVSKRVALGNATSQTFLSRQPPLALLQLHKPLVPRQSVEVGAILPTLNLARHADDAKASSLSKQPSASNTSAYSSRLTNSLKQPTSPPRRVPTCAALLALLVLPHVRPSPCRERVACSPNAPPPAAPGDAPRASGSGDSRSGASAHPRGDLRERRRGGPLLRL